MDSDLSIDFNLDLDPDELIAYRATAAEIGPVGDAADSGPDGRGRTAALVPETARIADQREWVDAKRGRVGRVVARAGSPIAWGALGVAAFAGLWSLIAWRAEGVPTPAQMVTALRALLTKPLTDNGAQGKGALLLVWQSLFRVMKGFAVATIVGIPLGLAIGSSKRAWRAINPLVQLLRPVSPLAWYPLGLVALKDAPKAQTFVIFVTALWPIVVNTAAGAAAVPRDHANVARVFRFTRRQRIRHVLMPSAMPGIVTGLRLSMGVAWMVIVAVEMLAGASGIGGFVWEAYNASNLPAVTAAIVLIGLVGVTMDMAFQAAGRRVSPQEATP